MWFEDLEIWKWSCRSVVDFNFDDKTSFKDGGMWYPETLLDHIYEFILETRNYSGLDLLYERLLIIILFIDKSIQTGAF